ncbi:MAG TPA: urea ABC transporter permease subunit UrtB [bacterium]
MITKSPYTSCRPLLHRLAAAALLLALCAASAMAADLKGVLKGLASDDRDKLVDAIEAAGALGDPAVLPILQAMQEDKLRIGGGKFYKPNADGSQLADLVSGQSVSAAGVKVEAPATNNRVMRAIGTAIAQLQIFSNDPATRLKSAQELAVRAGPEDEAKIKKMMERETDENIVALLKKALARIDIASPDQARRLKAIAQLGEGGDLQTKTELSRILATKEDGSPLEADPAVRAAATAAISEIDKRQSVIALFGNLLYGLSLGSVLLLAALGLAITFGLMGVINMAHGEMLMLGAYTTYSVQNLFRANLPGYFDYYLVVALPMAFIVCALVGVILERGILRFLYGRPLESLLCTWGISLMLIQTVRLIFGAQNVQVANPAWLSGGVRAFSGLVLPYSRIAIVALGAIVVIAVWLLLQRTSLGLQVRAVTQNRAMAASMGVRTNWVDMWTFALGSGVAGIGGVALSQLGNVGPELGQQYIVDSFMVVVLGGVGKIAGSVAGAMGLGIVAKYLEPFTDAVLAKIMLLVFIILFIQKRPQGIFALKGRAVES